LAAVCRLDARSPPLLNSEVQQVLRERGAFNQDNFSRALPVEKHAAEYLSVLCKTGKNDDSVNLQCKLALTKFALTSAETFQILNMKPRNVVEVYLIVEEMDTRYGDEADETAEKLVEVVNKFYPEEPSNGKS
jgi:hypothetical protein